MYKDKEDFLREARYDFMVIEYDRDKILKSKFHEEYNVYDYTPFDIADTKSNGSELIWYELRKVTMFFLRMYDFLNELFKYIVNNRWDIYEEIDDTKTVLYIKRRYGEEELQKYIQQEDIIQKEIDGEVRYFKRTRVLKERWFYIKNFIDNWKDELYDLNNIGSGRTYRVHIFKKEIKSILKRAKYKHGYHLDIPYPTDTILMYIFEDQYVEFWQGEPIPEFVWLIYETLEGQFKHLTYNKLMEISKIKTLNIYKPLRLID